VLAGMLEPVKHKSTLVQSEVGRRGGILVGDTILLSSLPLGVPDGFLFGGFNGRFPDLLFLNH